ncbi:hypothetical protein TrST_g7346 [Triparma strigata]|uniref:Uncharacterized protein n=1 Tax=Triparma strigata TaxID=1606541 RepID=A0A9W7EQR9_9STRA|nr:hypothetical protein TrST_g7346 [Triparma strigata]
MASGMSLRTSSTSGTILPGPTFDPNLVVNLAMRPKDHDPDTFSVTLSTLMDESANIYDRGLAGWAVGRILMLKGKDDKFYLKKQLLVQAGDVMDALVDVIGASKKIASDSSSSPKRKKKNNKKRKGARSADVQLQERPMPSKSDCDKICKNCSLIIVMLSKYLSEEDPDPYSFEPPPTPLYRMAATPEPPKVALNTTSTDKQRLMASNRAKYKSSKKSTLTDVVSLASSEMENEVDDFGLDDEGGGLDDLFDNANQSPSSEQSESPMAKERTYFRQTNNIVPDLTLADYMKAPDLDKELLGDKPHPRKTMSESMIAGELTNAEGERFISLSNVGNHEPRSSVLFDDEPAWDVPVPSAAAGDFYSKDSKLGYQVPRLYLGVPRPHTSNHRPTFPSPRGSPTELAKRPRTSDQIVSEYKNIETMYNLEEIRAMQPKANGYYELPGEDWKEKAFADGREVWTPSKGVNEDLMTKAWATTNFNSTTKKKRDVDKPATPKTPEPETPKRKEKKEKILFNQVLAGDAGSYENREIQRARDMMSTSTSFAFFPPNMSPPPPKNKTMTLDIEDDGEENMFSETAEPKRTRTATFSPESRSQSPKRAITANRPVSPYEIADIMAMTPNFNPGTFVELDDYRRLQLTTAQSKRASKRANLASAEAKEEYRRRRLHAIVRADDKLVPNSEIQKIARTDHVSIMSILENHKLTLQQHSASLKNKIDAAMHMQNKALPLRFLFTVEGGAEYCRQRLCDAFKLWIKGFETAQMATALSIWKVKVDEMVKIEKHAEYRAQAGRAKLKVIIREIDLRLFKRTFDRWNRCVSYLIYLERDATAVKIQAQIYRYRAKKIFLMMHDSCPIGGPLSDIYLAPLRKGIKYIINPRVRTEKRQFWAGALAIQTRFRMVTERTRYLLMKEAAIIVQSVWRMWVKRKEFMRLRADAILIESMARMIVKKWQYQRLLKAARLAQRVFRRYRAKLLFIALQKEYRKRIELKLSMPPRIQRAFRIFRAKRVVAKIKADKAELYDAAVRLQLFWYKLQGEFPRFVLLGVLRETDKQEKEFERLIRRYGREAHARKIQRVFKAHLQKRYLTAAVRIQCLARNAAGTNLVDKLRLEKWANRKLRHWARGMMKKRKRAATMIAFAWYHGKKGRFLQHLITMNARAEEKERREHRRQFHYAATVLQAVVHGVWTRRWIRRTRASIQIERVARGFMGRRTALRILRSLQSKVASAFIARMTHEAEIKEVQRIKKLKRDSSNTIGKVWRGYTLRKAMWFERERKRERLEAATLIQQKYRRMLEIKRARAKLLFMQRKLTSPFKDMSNICEIVDECFAKSDFLFNPNRNLCGVNLTVFCFRLGIMDDVLPLFQKHHITTSAQLFAMSDDDLIKVGIKEEIKGDRHFGIMHAAKLRETILTLGSFLYKNVSEMTLKEKTTYFEYNLLPNDNKKKSMEIRRVFETCYGDRYKSRAELFAQGKILGWPLTCLQLRRFFSIFDTPGKAKEHVDQLHKHNVTAEEHAWDDSRVAKAMDMMLYAAEKTQELVKGWRMLHYRIHHEVEIVEDNEQRKKRENRLGNATRSQINNHHKREREGAKALYDLLVELQEMDDGSRKLQQAARGFNAGRIMKMAREAKFVNKVKDDYLFMKNNNHVMDVWKEDRRKEQEEYDRQHKLWLIEEEKKRIEWELQYVMRHGWKEEWRQNEQVNDGDEGYYLYTCEVTKRVKREIVKETLELVDKPLYSYEQWMKLLVMQRLGRIYLAKTMVKRIKRDRLRAQKEAEEKEKWKALQKQRKQAVTLSFSFDTVTMVGDVGEDFDPDCIVLADEEDKNGEPVYEYDDGSTDTKDKFQKEADDLMDTDLNIELGACVQAKFQGGAIYYSGTVFQINPTEYISPQGIKWYPKNTFGIVYDDGDYEPAVHRDDIRVMKLKEGMKVEARFGGHENYFPGTVVLENVRGGKVLSYKIRYDDETEERAARRSLIKVSDELMNENDKKIKDLVDKSEEEKKRNAELRSKQIKKWFVKQDAIDDVLEEYEEGCGFPLIHLSRDERIAHVKQVYAEGWSTGEGNVNKKQNVIDHVSGNQWNHGTKDHRPDLEQMNFSAMAIASKKLFDLVRPSIRTTSTLKYTKLALPYGWSERYRFNEIVGYYNEITKQSVGVHDCPQYTFQEDLACRRLQSQWRALEGKRAFQAKLKNESVLGVLNLSVKESSKHSWINYGQEGMKLEMWLARSGLHEYYPNMMESYAKEMRKKGQGGGRRTSSAQGGRRISSADRRQSSASHDMSSSAERRMSKVGGGGNVDLYEHRRMSKMRKLSVLGEIDESSIQRKGSVGSLDSSGDDHSRGMRRTPSVMNHGHRGTINAGGSRPSLSPAMSPDHSTGGRRDSGRRESGRRPSHSTSPDHHTVGTGGRRGSRTSASPDHHGAGGRKNSRAVEGLGSRGGSRDAHSRGGLHTADGAHAHDPHHDPTVLTLPVFLRKSESNTWLESMGFKKDKDRQIIHSMKHGDILAKKSFEFINYFKDEHDVRSILHCIEDSKDAIYNLVLSKYRNNPQRVVHIADEICKSNFPVTVGQLQRFLSKYEGKPAMAQENVRRELVDIKTTGVKSEEKASFDILKAGITRATVLLNNLGVVELTENLQEALREAEGIITKGAEEEARREKTNEEEKERLEKEKVAEEEKKIEEEREKKSGAPGFASSMKKDSQQQRRVSNAAAAGLLGGHGHGTEDHGHGHGAVHAAVAHSGHEAKASLILRRDAVQMVIDWWNSTLLLQKRYRGHRERVKYKKLCKMRADAATKIQSNVRTHIFVSKLKSYLLGQYNSVVEQLWDDEKNLFYWFDKKSKQAAWEEPEIPYRPMIRDRFTQQLMQAWPVLDNALAVEKEAAFGICMICKEEEATRSCNQCEVWPGCKRVKWGNGYLHTCFICYSTFHSDTAEKRKHTFSVTKATMARPLTCVMCNGLATRRCKGLVLPEETKDRLQTLILQSLDSGLDGKKEEQISEEDFVEAVRVTLELDGYMSNERIAALYVECRGKFKEKRKNAEIWKRFSEHLEAVGEECDENYCDDCWENNHAKGRRKKHEWVGFKAGCSICVECEMLPALKYCTTCEDNYCAGCAKDTHRHGKKHRHVFEDIREELEPHQMHCLECDNRAGSDQCKFCKKSFCNSCLLFTHPKQCAVRIKLQGGRDKESHEVTCAVCEKPPDTMCQQCGDVYCSVKWMGNPGCFRKTHMKGKKKDHTCVPYTYLEDRQKHEEEEKLRAKLEQDEKLAKYLKEKAAREEFERTLQKKADARKYKLEVEAQKEFEEKHMTRMAMTAKKSFGRFLPSLLGGGGVQSKKSMKRMMDSLPDVRKMQEEQDGVEVAEGVGMGAGADGDNSKVIGFAEGV